MGAMRTHGDVDATGDMAGPGGIVTTSLVAETGAGGTGEGQRQQHPNGHAPQGAGGEIIMSPPLHPTEGRSHNGDTCSGMNRNPLAAPAAGAAAGKAPPPKRADQSDAPNGATDP